MGALSSGIASVQNPFAQQQQEHHQTKLQETQQKHAEEMLQLQNKAAMHLEMVQAAVKGEVPPEVGQFHLDEATKIPWLKEHKDNMQAAFNNHMQPKIPPAQPVTPTAPGAVPGTPGPAPVPSLGAGLGAAISGQPPAAQPAANPIQGAAQIQAPPPAPVAPVSFYTPQQLAENAGRKQSAVSSGQYNAQREAQMKELQDMAKFRTSQLESLRNPKTGNIEFTPETMLKAGALGIPMSGYGASAMMRTIHQNGITSTDFARQYPDEFAAAGINPSTTPSLDVVINQMTGRPISIQGKGLNMHFMDDGTGKIIAVNPVAPGAVPPVVTPGMSPNQSTPHFRATASGGEEMVTGAGMRSGQAPTPVPGAVSPAMLGTQGVRDQQVEVYNPETGQNEKRVIPMGTATKKVAPGGSTAPISAAPSASTPGRLIGPSAGEGRRQQENPLTAPAQNILMSTKPALTLVDKSLAEMKRLGMDKAEMPGTSFLPRLAYAMGYGTDQGRFLADLSMESIMGAGTLLKTTGGQRSILALQKALVHTPNAWKDSGKLMVDKMNAIKDRLKAVEDAAREEGQKYPGLHRPGQNSVNPVGVPAVGDTFNGMRVVSVRPK